MQVDQDKIGRIVEEVVRRYRDDITSSQVAPSRGIFTVLDDAVEATTRAQKIFIALRLEHRKQIIDSMRRAALAEVENLARMAVAETGMGRVEDKIIKNTNCILKTPGPEDLEAAAWSGDRGLTLIERGPYGVIGSVTPTTNTAATVINNSISMLSAGNGVVFNPHPRAKRVSQRTIEILNIAIEEAGGPANLLTSVAEPTQETSRALMHHPGIRMLTITGGPAVVGMGMKSGKKCIGAGPGNPPVVVDETADLAKAARDIVAGASFDNNIMCTCEKEIFVVHTVAEGLKAQMLMNRCIELPPHQAERLTGLTFAPPPAGQVEPLVNKDFIGQDAALLAKKIGLEVPADTRLLLIEVDESHPFVQAEQLMPIMPIVRVRDYREGIELAVKAEHGYFHTASMFSRNIEALSEMASRVNSTIFVKNGPTYAGLGVGGEGFISMTIAGPTGEGPTSARSFTRLRRCALIDYFRIV